MYNNRRNKKLVYISGQGFKEVLSSVLNRVFNSNNIKDIGNKLLDAGINSGKTALSSALETGAKLGGEKLATHLVEKMIPPTQKENNEKEEQRKKLELLQNKIKDDIEKYKQEHQTGSGVKKRKKQYKPII